MEFILPVVVIESIGDWSLTKYIQGGHKNIFYKLFGYASYIILIEFFQRAIETKGLAWANSTWDGYSNISTGILALFVFKEKPSMKQLFGMILVSFGIFLLGTDAIASYKSKST
jgi:multidrug transporter EmrE-like cation transporter